MRLWHWKLIPVLPRQQLLGQWRECCLIAKELFDGLNPGNKGLNHILVNPIMDYPEAQFNVYAEAVYNEILKRGYTADWNKFTMWRFNRNYEWDVREIFDGWHNDQYFWQCYYNLQEKHDRGGIADDEWQKIEELADQERSKSKWK